MAKAKKRFEQMMAELDEQVAAYDPEKAKQKYDKAMEAWTKKTADLRKANRDLPQGEKKRLPRRPQRSADAEPVAILCAQRSRRSAHQARASLLGHVLGLPRRARRAAAGRSREPTARGTGARDVRRLPPGNR